MGRKKVRKIIGIYTITNTIDNKIYIGRSNDIRDRLTKHKSKLRGNRHPNEHLQNSWNKYGEENFIFEILEEYPIELIPSMELYWANLLNVHNRDYGYNKEPIIPIDGIKKHSDETKEKLRLANIGKKATTETRNKLSIVGKKPKNFSDAYRKKLSDRMKIAIKTPKFLKFYESKKKKIMQFDLNENFIREWDSIKEAAETLNLCKSRISVVCRYNNSFEDDDKLNKLKEHGGFIWKFKK